MKTRSVLLLSTLVTAALLLVALLVAFSLTAGLTLAAPLDAPLTMPLRVFGTITADTVWTEAGSPYVVTDTLTVSEGVTLTIEPGVVVKFDDDKSLIVHGKLYAVGTPAKPILFTSNGAPAANTWGEIRLEQWVYPSTLRYCQIEYATQGLFLIDTVSGNQILNNVFRYNGGAIRSFQTWETFFANNVLAYNGYGFLFEGSGLVTILAGNAIHDNTQWGIKTDSSYTAWNSSFSSNAIHDNGGPGILFEAGGVNLPTVRGNALYGNGGYQLENQSTASLTADGNWWGTNAPSAGTTFTGTIAYSPPVRLSASRNPVSIPADGSSTSVVSALMTDGSGHYPPEGTYVSFTTTMGTVDSRLTEVESGAVGKEGQFVTSNAILGASGGYLHWSNTPGETITYTFTGDSIVYVYAMGDNCGYANVFVDGTAYPSIDMYSSALAFQVERVIATDLGPGTHTITVSVAGISNPHSSDIFVYADAFKVGSGDGLVTTTLTSGIIPGTATLTATAPGPASVATTVGFAPLGPFTVTLTRSPTSVPADGVSTSTITATVKDELGNDVPDGTVVTFTTSLGTFPGGPTTPSPTGVYIAEVEGPFVNRIGTWTPYGDGNASNGGGYFSNNVGDRVSYTFTGTKASVLFQKQWNAGIAEVRIDGVLYRVVDTYYDTTPPTGTGKLYQQEEVIADGLPYRSHTMEVIVTGQKNDSATDAYLVLDAFKVYGVNQNGARLTSGGVATVTVSSNVTGTATITGTSDSASGTTTVDFGLTLGPPATVTLEASPATLPVNDTSRLTATVLDQYANPLPGQVITFSTSSGLGSGGISPVTATTNGSGQAVSYISSTITGIKLVVATAPNLVAGTTTVTFTAPSGCEDDYEPDNSVEYATTVTPPSTTHHNFDTANDLDWVRFWGLAGITYTIETVNLAVSGDQQVDTKILFYYESDAVKLADDDDSGEPDYGSKIVWPVTTTGWYYVNVGQVIGSWSFTGCNTYYDLRISGPPTGVYLPIILKNYPPPPPTPTPPPPPVCCPAVEDTVGVGDMPRGIAINTATNHIYVANYNDDTISVINGDTNSVDTIDLSAYGSGPSGIAYHPSGFLYVSLGDSDTVAIINASTGLVEKTVNVGHNPAGVAVNPVSGKVYVANYDDDTVWVISGDIVVGIIPVEDRPSQIAVNPVTNLIFVTNHGYEDNYGEGSSVSVIDSTDTVTKTIRLVLDVSEPGQAPHGIAVNPVTNKIYVAVIDSRHLVVIDGNDLDARPTYIAPPLAVPIWLVAVNPGLNRVYAVGTDEASVHKVFTLDGATNAWLPCDLDVGSYPEYGIAFNSETGWLYVSNRGSDDVTVIWTCSASGPPPTPTPTATPTVEPTEEPTVEPTEEPADTPTPPPSECYPVVEATVNVGSDPHGVATGNGKIYVANRGANSVSVIRLSNYTWEKDIAVSGGPNGVAYDYNHKVFYVTRHDLNQMAVISSTTGAVITSVTVGVGPHGVAYNPTANKIYVANYNGHTVTVLNGNTYATIVTLSVPGVTEPAHVAVNPVTNKIYVTYHGSGKLGVIDGNTNQLTFAKYDNGGDAQIDDPYGVAVDTLRNLVYVACIGGHRITVFDGSDDTFEGWAEFHKGQDPEQPAPLRVIAVIPDLGASGHVYVTTCSGDGGFDKLLAIPKGWYECFSRPYAIDVGGNPQEGIAVAANRVFVTSRNANHLTIIADGEPPCMWNFALDFTFTLCRVGIEGDCR
ncbi:MAG: invasin domain 3-containing protein [Anaerolineae bacterium]